MLLRQDIRSVFNNKIKELNNDRMGYDDSGNDCTDEIIEEIYDLLSRIDRIPSFSEKERILLIKNQLPIDERMFECIDITQDSEDFGNTYHIDLFTWGATPFPSCEEINNAHSVTDCDCLMRKSPYTHEFCNCSFCKAMKGHVGKIISGKIRPCHYDLTYNAQYSPSKYV